MKTLLVSVTKTLLSLTNIFNSFISFVREIFTGSKLKNIYFSVLGHYTNALQQRLTNGNNLLNKTPSRKDMTPYLNAVNRMDSEENLKQQPWIMSMIQNQEGLEQSDIMNENERNILMQLKKENTVKGELINYFITK